MSYRKLASKIASKKYTGRQDSMKVRLSSLQKGDQFVYNGTIHSFYRKKSSGDVVSIDTKGDDVVLAGNLPVDFYLGQKPSRFEPEVNPDFQRLAKRVAQRKMASKCPIRTEHYGGLPASGGFGSYREYEIGAARIAEAAHCILGSIGRSFHPDKGFKGYDSFVEKRHINEEYEIIKKAVDEYQKGLYLKQLKERKRGTYAMIESVKKAAPKLLRKAKTKKSNLDIEEHPILDEIAKRTYDVVIALCKHMLKSVDDIEEILNEGEISVVLAYNAYAHLDRSQTVQRLGRAIDKLNQIDTYT